MQDKRYNWMKRVLFLLALVGAAAFIRPLPAEAASQPVTVSSCKLNSSGKKLTVKAKVKQKTRQMGSKLYLIKMDAQASETGAKKTSSLASVKAKKGTISFKVNYKTEMLFQKFAVAYKKGGKYQIVSDVRYLTNPEVLASYKGKGPTASSKKGLQVEHLEDSLQLGTQHAVVNWTLNSLLNNKAIHKTSFKYRGKTYYLDADMIQKNDELVQAYNAAGVRVTVILLLPKDPASSGTSAMQYGGYSYTKFSSFKTGTKAGCRTFEAIMHYLANRYGTKENLVSGWILGNEVNSACIWNYGGNKSLNTYMSNYARAFRICHNAVRSVSKNAKVYISLDYNWNTDTDGAGRKYFSTKATLDKFYQYIKSYGKIPFQIAYHAYPQGLGDPVFWDDSQATNSTYSKIVNFKNLSVLTKYAKSKFGNDCKIMLSEQSFNSTKGEAVQAAAYAYAYYISESNSRVEAFIYGREFDHPAEAGYLWGLWDRWYVKRMVWSVFQFIDTKESFSFSDPLLPYTNLSGWTKISNFKKTKITGKKSGLKQASVTNVESASTTSVSLTWNKIPTADGYEIYRNGSLVKTVTDGATVSYKDTGLKTGATYKYEVRMYKEAPKKGNVTQKVKLYGAKSKAASIVVSTDQAEIVEENCAVNGNDIKIAWKKQSNASGFEIYRSMQLNSGYALIGTAAAGKTSYTDKALSSGVFYYYKVRPFVTVGGKNYYGKESLPTEQQAKIKLTAQIVNGKVVLSWTRWKTAVKYRLLCKKISSSEFKKAKTVGDVQTYSLVDYVDETGKTLGFTVGDAYAFCLRVENLDGSLEKKYSSNEAELTITEPITPDDPKPPVVTPDEPVTPVEPITPTDPVTPVEPITPTDPVTPVEPITPTDPVTPDEPTTPADPVTPDEPTTPADPVTPVEPITPQEPVAPKMFFYRLFQLLASKF